MRIGNEINVLKKLIQKQPEGSQVLNITPEVAEYILSDLNIGNRPQKPDRIVAYASDMVRSNWSLTGEAIKFGSDGLLKDGQNRLFACVRAQTPFKTHAVFGVDPDSFHHMDTGKARGADDVLAIMGVPNAGKIALALKMIKAFRNGRATTSGGMTNQEIKDMYLKFTDHDLIQDAYKSAKQVYSVIGYPVGQTTALYYLATKNGDGELVKAFFEELKGSYSKGVNVKYHPPRHLVNTIQSWKFDPTIQVNSFTYSIALSRSWYNYKRNKNNLKRDMVIRVSDRMMEI